MIKLPQLASLLCGYVFSVCCKQILQKRLNYRFSTENTCTRNTYPPSGAVQEVKCKDTSNWIGLQTAGLKS